MHPVHHDLRATLAPAVDLASGRGAVATPHRLAVLRSVTGPGLALLLVLLTTLGGVAGLGASGWTVAVGCGLLAHVLLARALLAEGRRGPGPADVVTLTRATLAFGVAGLVATSLGRGLPDTRLVGALVALTGVALALDWVDGRVARRTRTVTALGARFDMEVDAFLILVLSVYAARSVGPWVLAIGLARYLLLAARRVAPWLRRPAPPRHWCKVVAAFQGVALAVVAAGVLPARADAALLLLALLLLAESFGREAWWQWRRRA